MTPYLTFNGNCRDAMQYYADRLGATITFMARNVYLSTEKTFTRKIYEILLTFKLEHLLSKDQILEIYMNQIFLGNRAYGFSAASEIYFGKSLKDITVAEDLLKTSVSLLPVLWNRFLDPEMQFKSK